MTTGKRKFHDFCFTNVITPELDRAATFFHEVLGWTYGDGIPGGKLILVDGRVAGALVDVKACPPETPPVIAVMLKVESADAAVARVNELGGHAKPAFDVLANGRMALCTDPDGASFDVWEPRAQDGAECDSFAHGAPTWFELHTTDAARAVKFYQALFGWRAVEDHPAPGMTYTILKHGEVAIGGAMRLFPDQRGKVPPHWGTYFAVKNADETVRIAKERGAELCMGPHDIPNIGRFALLRSPQGVSFHVIQYAAAPPG